MAISESAVAHIATLARLHLSDEELRRMTGELARILDYVETLNELDLDDVPPMSYVASVATPLRDDIVCASDVRDAALAGAPDADAGHFRVPKVVGS